MNIVGQPGELRFTIEVKRAETGQVETYDLVGYLDENKLKELQNAAQVADGSVPVQN